MRGSHWEQVAEEALLAEKKPGRTEGESLGAPTGVLLVTGAEVLPPAPDAVFLLRVRKSAPN